jgi:hypothetical protein
MPKPKYIKELKEYYMNKSKKSTKSTKSTKYGGGDGDEDTFDGDEFDSIMKYILHKLNDKIKAGTGQGTTGASKKEKHLIMLYGPPASGKSIAKKIMLSKLKIGDSDYIDINLDDIIGDNRKYKYELEELKKEHGNTSAEPSDNIKKRATDLYFSIRKKANLVFELLVFITRLYDISLVVEVTGGTYCSMVWWDNILRFFKTKKYTISLIYPVVTEVDKIVSRADERGKEIFRFVSSVAIRQSIEGAKMNIKTIIDDSRAMFRKFDNIYIYTNEDANFVSYAKENKTQELLDLFDNNILYKKERGIVTPRIEKDFIKEIKRKSNIFYDKQNMPLIPETCGLTY